MSRGRPGRPIMCVETGRVFESVTEAAEWLGLNASCVSRVLAGYTKTAGGYRWEYIDTEESAPKKQDKPRSAPAMTITEVQEEARRRTEETGRYTRYADIQKEETVLMLRRQSALDRLKQKRREKG